MSLEIIKELRKLEDQGYVSSSEYKNLILFNYSDKCTFDRHWNKYTLEARGTIYNKDTGEVVARALPKFFNYGEMGITDETLPKTKFVATVKWDGSCGIVRKDEEGFKVSTRGSFYSEQAVEATKMANESPYKEAFEEMLQYGTPLVEIIYPSNRIVVNYGDERKLVVLAIRRLDGTYLPIKQSEDISHAHGVEHTMIIDNVSLEELLRLQKIINWQEEGWVLVYENGYRLKIKGIDYLRIAKIKSSLSPLSVWEAMEAGKAEEYLASMPDEIHDEAKAIYNNLTAQYATLFEKVTLLATQLGLGPKMTDNVKEDAIKIQKEAPKWAVNMMFAFMRCRWDTLKELVLKEIRPDANKYVDLKKYL